MTLNLLSVESMSGTQLIALIYESITVIHLKKASDVVEKLVKSIFSMYIVVLQLSAQIPTLKYNHIF